MTPINEAFRAYLQAHGIKQKDLAEAGGYGEGPMSKALSPKNKTWNMRTVERMMEALAKMAPEAPPPALVYLPGDGWEIIMPK
jgi:hypothetical protein